ncbi:MAG TPA: T9SS type A sorting domain-containing protein [Candidatus Eisenbacteria bacterium]|jgi:hypothetical protein
MHRRLPTFASISATALAIVVASAFPAHAQNGTWSSLPADAPNLGPRREFGAIFDRANQRYLTFDGFNGNNYGLYILFNDVWQLSVAGDPPVWSNITFTGTVPGARHTPQWGYDAARNRVLMFGGYGSHYPGYPYAYLDDVWELDLDGTPHWRELFPAGQAPSGRLAGAAVFDPIRQRFVGFGGTIGVPVDTWSLNLQGQANWELVPTNGAAPKGGYGMTSVYDARGDRLLMFGGSINDNYYYANNDVWELDLHGNPTWHLVVTAGTPPQARRSGTAIWDPLRNRMVIYGGFDAIPYSDQFLPDTWALDFNTATPTWTQLVPAGTTPVGRADNAAVYDPIHDRMIFYGGWDGNNMLSDTQFLNWGSSTAEAALAPTGGATPNSAHVDWSVSATTGTHAGIYRRAPGGDWSALGEGEVVAGHLVYDDATVQEGNGYSYEAVVASQRGETFGGETFVQVPTTTAVNPGQNLEFALRGASPNPAFDRMSVSFVLASDAPATLELVDVSGRRVLERAVESLGTGEHRVDFALAGRVPAGLYFLRLRQAGRTAATRVAVTGGE